MTLRDTISAFQPGCEQEQTDRRLMLQYFDLFPNLLTRDNELAHLTASCWIVDPRRELALMAYHNLYRSWAWLGGHADGDADLLRVALREAKEESGIAGARPLCTDPVSLEILGVNAHRKRGRYVAPHLHLNLTYLLEADDTLPLREKPDENSAVRWIPMDELESAVSEPEMRIIYRKLIERSRRI